jgi:hypothetical protein
MIKNFKSYLVEEEREVFFTFGRMNPPTIGHGKVIDTLVKKSRGSDYKIFVSQSSDPKKNPLSYSDKVKHIRKMFPKHGRNVIVDKSVKNAIDVATKLYNMGYKKVTMIVGDDQVRTFDILLNKYNGKKAKHGFYNFEKLNVVSAGRRDPDAEGVEGMSATKMRKAATDNDYQSFTMGVPKSMSDKDTRKLFNDVRRGMGLKENFSFKNHIDLGKHSDTREAYVSGELFEIGDMVAVKESEEVGIVSVLGANYVIVEMNGKRLRKWLDDVELVEKTRTPQDPEIGKDVKGTQPKKYYAKDAEGDDMSAATKKKRAAHFKKGTAKDDDDSSAYKPAPGDKGAETKPSKYTKSFKQMYGESGAGEEGTDKLVKKYKKDTPMQENVDEKFFGKAGAFGDKSIGGMLMPAFDQWMDKKVYNKKRYEKAVRGYLNWRRKNPGAGSSGAFDYLRSMGVERPRLVIDFMHDMIKKGKLPKSLSLDTKSGTKKGKTVFPEPYRPIRAQTEALDPRKHDAGDYISDFMKSDAPQFKGKSKEEIRKMAIAAYLDAKRKAGMDEDAVAIAKDKISREREQDKKKHDRMLDRAYQARARNKSKGVNVPPIRKPQ